MTKKQKEHIVIMRMSGMGYKQIAKTLDVPTSTIKSFCKLRRLGGNAEYLTYDSKTFCKMCDLSLLQRPKQKPKTFCSDRCRWAWHGKCKRGEYHGGAGNKAEIHGG